jgi:hypothetical protein
MRIPPASGTALALLLLAAAGPASAGQNGYPTVDLERLTPVAMAEGAIGAGTGEVGPRGGWRVALSLQALSRPLIVDDAGDLSGGGYGATGNQANLIDMRFGAWLAGAYAVLDGLEVHAAVPAVLGQDGPNQSSLGYLGFDRTGVGSPRLGARWTVLSRRDLGSWRGGWPLAVAVATDAALPLGRAAALTRDPGVSVSPRLELAMGGGDGLLALELGARLRTEAIPLGRQLLRHELDGALVVAGTGQPLRAEASVRAQAALGTPLRSIQLLVGGRVRSGPVEFFVAAGPAFRNTPGTPELRGLFGVAWLSAPRGDDERWDEDR